MAEKKGGRRAPATRTARALAEILKAPGPSPGERKAS